MSASALHPAISRWCSSKHCYWSLFSGLLLVSLLMSVWWVRYVPIEKGHENTAIKLSETTPTAVDVVQMTFNQSTEVVTLQLDGQPDSGAIQWHWMPPFNASAARISGSVTYDLVHDQRATSAGGYVRFRQPAEAINPWEQPLLELAGQREHALSFGRTVRLLPDAEQVSLTAGVHRTSGEIRLTDLRLQWLQQRPVLIPVWWGLLVGWAIWLTWLASRWWTDTPGPGRLVWLAALLCSVPLLVSFHWLNALRLWLLSHTGIDVAHGLPGNFAIGEVVHFLLFLTLTLCAMTLLRNRAWYHRLLDMVALGTATEFIQEYVPGRSLRLSDWGTNLAGIATACLLFWVAQQAIRTLRPTPTELP